MKGTHPPHAPHPQHCRTQPGGTYATGARKACGEGRVKQGENTVRWERAHPYGDGDASLQDRIWRPQELCQRGRTLDTWRKPRPTVSRAGRPELRGRGQEKFSGKCALQNAEVT